MKNLKSLFFAFSLFVAAVLAAPTDTFAQAAEPQEAEVCPDADGDGYYLVVQGCVPPQGKKRGDCDDGHPARYPSNLDIPDNGLDEDCDGADFEMPDGVTLASFGLTLRDRAKVKRWQADVLRCQADDRCKVLPGGYSTPKGFYFMDAHCTGKREVIDQAEKDRIDELERRDAFCKKPAVRKPKPRAKKPAVKAGNNAQATAGQSNASASADQQGNAVTSETAAKATEAATKAGEAADKATEAANGAAEAATKATAEVGSLRGEIETMGDELRGEIEAETERAKAAEAELDKKADLALNEAKQAKGMASSAFDRAAASGEKEGSGAVFGLSLGAASNFASPLMRKYQGSGKTYQMRGTMSPGLAVGGYVGYKHSSATLRAFGQLNVLADEGPTGWESTLGAVAGFDAYPASWHGLGLHLSYLQTEIGGSVVGSNAASRAGLIGPALSIEDVGSSLKLGLDARFGVGIETAGTGVQAAWGPVARLEFSFRFGFGPK